MDSRHLDRLLDGMDSLNSTDLLGWTTGSGKRMCREIGLIRGGGLGGVGMSRRGEMRA